MRRELTHEFIASRFKEFDSIKAVQNADKAVYNAAYKKGILKEVSSHMTSKRSLKTLDQCKEIALLCNTKIEFKTRFSSEYQTACKYGFLDSICSHMTKQKVHRSNDELAQEALRYTTRIQFQKESKNAYEIARSRNLLDKICGHMQSLKDYEISKERKKRTAEELAIEAKKFSSRKEFAEKNGKCYNAANRKKILDKVCAHMPIISPFSRSEQSLMLSIKDKYPKAQKFYDRKVKIENKPHIKGFELDIYVPEIRKAIEFNGEFWHSVEGLKKGRPSWPEEDLRNYHQIKEQYFASKNIKILYVTEKEWLNDKQLCIQKCLEFLGE